VLESGKEKDWKRVGYVQPTAAQYGCTGLSGDAPDSVRCARLGYGELATLGNSSAAYGYNSSDCPVSQRPPAQRSAAQSGATRGPHQRSAGGTGQCPVRQPAQRSNGRLRQEWKEIRIGHATVAVRWCTGLSGAPPDRRQELLSLLGSNDS
jgi:hypothetical protein